MDRAVQFEPAQQPTIRRAGKKASYCREEASALQVPRKFRPSRLARFPCIAVLRSQAPARQECLPRGRVRWSGTCRQPPGTPEDAEVGPRAEASMPGWELGRPRAAAVLSQRTPWSLRTGKAGAVPRARPRATGSGLHLDGCGPRRDVPAGPFGRYLRVASPRARPPPAGKCGGPGRPKVPRASRATTHLAARGSHMAAAGGSAPGPPPPREALPCGQGAAGSAEARKLPEPGAGAARCRGGARGPPARWGSATQRRSEGAGAQEPRRPGCVQPQTYSKFPRSCESPKTVACTSLLSGRGCLSSRSKGAFRCLPSCKRVLQGYGSRPPLKNECFEPFTSRD